MRLYAIAASAVAVAGIVGLGSVNVSADTTNSAATSNTSGPAQNSVTVQQGDTLSAIADSNNTTYVRIFDANQQIQDPNLIYPGENVLIPSADEQLTDRALPSDGSTTTSTDSDVDQVPSVQSTVSIDPTPAPETTVAPAPAVASGSIWDQLAQCESGGNWSIDTGNGYYGGLQFTLSSWQAVGGTGYPNQASRNEQIQLAQRLQSMQGWGAWPVCSAKLGL